MKKIKLIIYFIILLSIKFISSQAGWNQQFSISNYEIWSIFFVNAQTGFCVGNDYGDNTCILKTTNIGSNWTVIFSQNSRNDFFCLYFVDENTGYAAGGDIILQNSSLIYKTTNCGNNWISQSTNESTIFHGIQFINVNTGIVAGSLGIIMKTTNGGNNWIQKASNTSSDLRGLFFPNSNSGYAVGKNGTIIKTTDGGENWLNLNSGVNYTLHGVYFTSVDVGTVTGNNTSANNGIILKTINGGVNWINQSSSLSNFNTAYALCYINNDTGFVGVSGHNGGNILYTFNGGLNWFTQFTPTNYLITDIFFINNSTGFACGTSGLLGTNGFILKTTNSGLTFVNNFYHKPPSKYVLRGNYPNPFNPSTKIKFEVPEKSNVQITVYNAEGKEITTIIDEQLKPGTYETEWDGSAFASGIYFYRLNAGDYLETKKMILLK